MGTLATGEVVLVPFPFSDLTQSKVRPAVCLADAGSGDFILCQITSSPYGDPRAQSLGIGDFSTGGLVVHSHARPGKLFTAIASLALKTVGLLNSAAFLRVLVAVVDLFQSGIPPTPATGS